MPLEAFYFFFQRQSLDHSLINDRQVSSDKKKV